MERAIEMSMIRWKANKLYDKRGGGIRSTWMVRTQVKKEQMGRERMEI